MDQTKKQAFTVRISQGSRSELTAIIYDILDVYLEDALSARERDDYEGFRENVRQADRVIRELQDALDHKYGISGNLYRIYQYQRERLALALSRYRKEEVEETARLAKTLGDAFRELAKTDHTGSVMRNAEKVSYGVTYGRNDINETIHTEANRGFLV